MLISEPFYETWQARNLHIANLWSAHIKHSEADGLCSLFRCPWKFYYRNPFAGLKWLIPRSLWTSAEPVGAADVWRFPCSDIMTGAWRKVTGRHLACAVTGSQGRWRRRSAPPGVIGCRLRTDTQSMRSDKRRKMAGPLWKTRRFENGSHIYRNVHGSFHLALTLYS